MPAATEIESAPPTVVDLDSIADPTVEPSSLMEEAILGEASHPDGDAIADVAAQAELLLEDSWESASMISDIDDGTEDFEALEALGPFEAPDSPESLEPDPGQVPLLGPELTIASVGEATRCGERSVRVPLVVADKEGRSSTLILTISLDTLPNEAPD